jgi:phage shock protein A
MGFFRRVNTIIVAQVNDIVDAFDNPERLLKQAIREMEDALRRALESTARAIALERRLRQQAADARARIESWQARATESLNKGDEEAARRAVARKLENDRLANDLAKQHAHAEETAAALRRRLDSMRGRLAEARRQLAELVARQRSAEARKQFATALGQFQSDIEAFDRFEEMSRRVSDAEAEVELLDDLSGLAAGDELIEADVEAEFHLLRNASTPSAG